MNRLTPGSNQMWEGSRMMLPEHVDWINQHQREFDKKTKPELDEQSIAELSQQIAEAQHHQYIVTVQIFDEYEVIQMIGQITSIDVGLRRIKIIEDDISTWIYFDDILSIEKAW